MTDVDDAPEMLCPRCGEIMSLESIGEKDPDGIDPKLYDRWYDYRCPRCKTYVDYLPSNMDI